VGRGRERRIEKRSIAAIRRPLRAGTLGSATLGLLLVFHTGASTGARAGVVRPGD